MGTLGAVNMSKSKAETAAPNLLSDAASLDGASHSSVFDLHGQRRC